MKNDTMIFKRESMRLLLTLVQDKIAALAALEEVLLDMDRIAGEKCNKLTEVDIEEVRRQIRENNADGSNKEPVGDPRKTMPDMASKAIVGWDWLNNPTRKIGFEHGD